MAAADGYEVALADGQIVCRPTGGKVLKSVPKLRPPLRIPVKTASRRATLRLDPTSQEAGESHGLARSRTKGHQTAPPRLGQACVPGGELRPTDRANVLAGASPHPVRHGGVGTG
jgi:hypothetical protein